MTLFNHRLKPAPPLTAEDPTPLQDLGWAGREQQEELQKNGLK
jgi:hypothetical protein